MGDYQAFQGADGVAHRVVGANIPFEWLVYVFAAAAAAVFAYGVWRNVRFARMGKPNALARAPFGRRLKDVCIGVFLQPKVRKASAAGWGHFLMFWSLTLLLAATAITFASVRFGWPPIEGSFYVVFSLVADCAGAVGIACLAVLGFVRYVKRPSRLSDTKVADGMVLLLLVAILVSGFVVEGARIHAQVLLTPNVADIAYEQVASPVGWLFQYLFAGMDVAGCEQAHRVAWWIHMILGMMTIALVPYTKLWHAVASLGQFAVARDDSPVLQVVADLENTESVGIADVADLRCVDLGDLDACVRCGRCQDACPAFAAGLPLSPKLSLIQAMKDNAHEQFRVRHGRQGEGAGDARDSRGEDFSLLYDTVTTRTLWSCTNCGACVEACPLGVDHIGKLEGMRRNLVMWQGDVPAGAQTMLRNVERNANPWGVGKPKRADWVVEQQVEDLLPLVGGERLAEDEVLFFAGCAASYDDAFKRVAGKAVKLLAQGGMRLRYLGTREPCCGDSVRRLGDEYLFQEMARMAVETLDAAGVRKIVTLCPHCMNVLLRDLRQFGGAYEVEHVSQALLSAVRSGALVPAHELGLECTYQSPCFLGRANGVEDEPRILIESCGCCLTGQRDVDVAASCCGGGGGQMWLDMQLEQGEQRISDRRASQLWGTGAQHVVTACPYCRSMVADAKLDGMPKAPEDGLPGVVDVVDLLYAAVMEREKV